MMFLTLQCVNHLVNKVVDIEKFEFYAWVVDGDGEVVGDVVAECGYGTVIVWTTPFTIEIWETVDLYFGSSFLAIFKEQVLTSLLASTVLAIAETSSQGCLLRA